MKRVYKEVTTRPVDEGLQPTGLSRGGWGLALDGRPMGTPGKNALVLPTEALALAIAAEWDAQREEIRPATMPLFRLAATAIDRTVPQRDLVVSETANYAHTDLVCYRADHPPALAERQHAIWQPLIDWARLRYETSLAVTAGILPARQPPATLQVFASIVAAQDEFRLTALHSLTAACGSLIIALALFEGRLDCEAAFAASQLDESFQIEAWGEDSEATARRQSLAADIAAAARFVALLGND
jgi:chaperone required for assembly of F1-ATPase